MLDYYRGVLFFWSLHRVIRVVHSSHSERSETRAESLSDPRRVVEFKQGKGA